MPTPSFSRFVNLSNYCVVEYMFEPLGSLDYYTDAFYVLKNSNTGTNQIYNTDVSLYSTSNIKDLTVTETPNGRFAYLDSEINPNYTEYDSNLTESVLTGNNVVMDQVRFHFVSGFDFNDFEALILNITHEQNNGENNIFANILLSPDTYSTLITFNDKPLFLSNALYDRYVDIWVPSIKNINEEFVTAPVQANTFAAEITPTETSYTGLVYNNPFSIKLIVCNKKHILYTNDTEYETFEANQVFEATLSQSNEFDGVGTVIQEADTGDFIEFFMTFNSAFPEELISLLNKRNPSNDWIIIHQLSIFEQVGTNFIPTARQVFFQESGFDEPNVFRPVLKYANEAVSVSIDYLVRLTNKLNGEQIIREGSIVLTNPKKYGKSLLNIPLTDPPTSHTVYNKIIKKDFEASPLFVEPTAIGDRPTQTGGITAPTPTITSIVKTEYVPIFFSNNKITVSNKSAMVTSTSGLKEIVFGPNALRFIISPFDNFLKFKFYTEYKTETTSSTAKIIPLDLNISNTIFRMVFETDAGKISIDNMQSSLYENPASGEIAFKIAKKDSEAIIASVNRTVYFISVSQDGTETLLYSGQWRKPSEQSDVDAAVAAAKAEADERDQLESKLEEINQKISDLTAKYEKGKAITQTVISSIKEVAAVPVVNKFGVKKASKIKTNVNNAGK